MNFKSVRIWFSYFGFERSGVHGHFSHDYQRPWVSIDDLVVDSMARVVGAKREEVSVLNSLTVNLHLLMVSFYRPTAQRHKIIIEDKAFPSDHVGFPCGLLEYVLLYLHYLLVSTPSVRRLSFMAMIRQSLWSAFHLDPGNIRYVMRTYSLPLKHTVMKRRWSCSVVFSTIRGNFSICHQLWKLVIRRCGITILIFKY